MSIGRTARLLEATAPDAFASVQDAFADALHLDRIERPQPINTGRVSLSRSSMWADCPLCGADVNACKCDPDEYAAAVYRMQRAKQSADVAQGEG